jgi:hypothetical protein
LTQLNLPPPLFSAEVSRVTAPPLCTRGTVCAPPTTLQLLPGLLFAKTVRSAIRSIAVPIAVCLSGRADQLLTVQLPFLLFRVFRQVYPKSAVHIGTGSRVSFCEEECHLLVYAVVFGVYGGGGLRGRAHGCGVHVGDEVCVVGLFGPEVCACVYLTLTFRLDYAAIRP